MNSHGTDIIRPEFKFEIVTCYKDPMRRQLAEALLILEKGELNKKNEINSNEVCRLAPKQTVSEIVKVGKDELSDRLDFDMRFRDFVNVMSRIVITNQEPNQTFLQNCRHKRKNNRLWNGSI